MCKTKNFLSKGLMKNNTNRKNWLTQWKHVENYQPSLWDRILAGENYSLKNLLEKT